ncbi:MAG: tetratricopeptide repeat protein [Flavobacterium sp. JAD_PAG50586_2]|nr:MAG: tetratricopeptide repeat protein [Flavobacterium sp. JAD_PAG50586_2]
MKNLLAIVALLISFTCFSQEFQLSKTDKKIIDSLNTLLSKPQSDSLKSIVHFKLSLIYGKNKNKNLSKKHLQKANKLINDNAYLKDISLYYNAINLELSEASVKELQAANDKLKKYNSNEVYSIRTKIYSNIGLFLQRQNKTLEAIKIFTTKAIPLAKKANNNQELAFLYKLIALVFYNNDDITQAADYLDLSIKTLEEKPINNAGYEKDLIETYLFYTEVLSVQKNSKKGEYFLSKAKSLLKKNMDPNLYLEYYFAEGALLHERKDYASEIKIYDKGIALARSTNDYYADIRFNLLKFDILRLQKNIQQRKIY